MAQNPSVARDKLLDDFNKVVNDTEELLKSVANVGGEKAVALRATVEENLKATRAKLRDLQKVAVDKTAAAAEATDDYVHENPWQAIALAAGVGVLVGLLLSRR
jgi:ElaB/YqjD/DUF883 family membrane-anchored ribosome-binding protein